MVSPGSVNEDRNHMSYINRFISARRSSAAVPRRTAKATVPVLMLTLSALGNLLLPVFAKGAATDPPPEIRQPEIHRPEIHQPEIHQPGITVKNAVPEFTLTLPDRYVQLKSTGDALWTFGTKDQTAGAMVGIYSLGHTIEPDTAIPPRVPDPGARHIAATWKTFPIDVTAWHPPAQKNGSSSAALWTQIPLQQQAISIIVLVPVAKEAIADGLMQDFLSGLDGPSNWRVEQPLTSGQRAFRLALGLVLAVVLLAGPLLTFLAWRRSVARKTESNSATALRQRSLAAAMAQPPTANPRYWLRVFGIVFALIAVLLAYLCSQRQAYR